MTTCHYVPLLVKSQEIGCDLAIRLLCTLDLTVRESKQVDHPCALYLHLKDCSKPSARMFVVIISPLR